MAPVPIPVAPVVSIVPLLSLVVAKLRRALSLVQLSNEFGRSVVHRLTGHTFNADDALIEANLLELSPSVLVALDFCSSVGMCDFSNDILCRLAYHLADWVCGSLMALDEGAVRRWWAGAKVDDVGQTNCGHGQEKLNLHVENKCQQIAVGSWGCVLSKM